MGGDLNEIRKREKEGFFLGRDQFFLVSADPEVLFFSSRRPAPLHTLSTARPTRSLSTKRAVLIHDPSTNTKRGSIRFSTKKKRPLSPLSCLAFPLSLFLLLSPSLSFTPALSLFYPRSLSLFYPRNLPPSLPLSLSLNRAQVGSHVNWSRRKERRSTTTTAEKGGRCNKTKKQKRRQGHRPPPQKKKNASSPFFLLKRRQRRPLTQRPDGAPPREISRARFPPHCIGGGCPAAAAGAPAAPATGVTPGTPARQRRRPRGPWRPRSGSTRPCSRSCACCTSRTSSPRASS